MIMINITKKTDCCGCSACSSICSRNAIVMASDTEGFLYPKVNMDLCSDCGLCERVCPILNKNDERFFQQKAYLVQNKNKQILKESTSGGAFTAIAESVINRGGMVFGAAFDSDFNVIHLSAESISDLAKFRNSKYVQSNVGYTFRQVRDVLKSGRLVCYSGTPCQIEGLISFLMKDYDNLLTIDIVCHATPSPLIWNKYKRLISEGNDIISASFRDKRQYGYDYSQMSVYTTDKQYYEGVYTDPFLRAFFSNLSDRPSCYKCAFKKRYRVSDVTIWDCFEAHKFDKRLDNNSGVTRVLTHSEKGEKLIASILNSVNYVEVEADKLVDGVKEMYSSVPMNPKRKAFFSDAHLMDDRAFFEKYFPYNLRIKTERFIRHSSQKLGVYRIVKRTVKKVLGK